MRYIKQGVVILMLTAYSQSAVSWEFFSKDDNVYLMGGLYTHFSSSDDHKGPPLLVSVEILKPNDWFYGLSLFNNSFGQFTEYVYFGKEFKFNHIFQGLRSKVSVGLIHGYKDEFKGKIPFNNAGIAPAIIPGIGYQKGNWGADIYLMGNSGLLFGLGYEF